MTQVLTSAGCVFHGHRERCDGRSLVGGPRHFTRAGGNAMDSRSVIRASVAPRQQQECFSRDFQVDGILSQWCKDDTLAVIARTTTTFGDIGRQDFGLRIKRRCCVSPASGSPVVRDDFSKSISINNFMDWEPIWADATTHARLLMGWMLEGRKEALDTTNNDNTQNRLDHSLFSRGRAGPFRRSAGGFRRELMIPRGSCCRKPVGAVMVTGAVHGDHGGLIGKGARRCCGS